MLLFISISQSTKKFYLESGCKSHSIKHLYICLSVCVCVFYFYVFHLVLNFFYPGICNSTLKRYRNVRNLIAFLICDFHIYIFKNLVFTDDHCTVELDDLRDYKVSTSSEN